MGVETIGVVALHGAHGGLTWVAWANSRGVAVFLVLWPWVSGNLWGACSRPRTRSGCWCCARPPADHPPRERYGAIVTEHLEPLLTRWGRPFEILHMDTGISPHGGLAPYVNSVVLNKVVYVPRCGIPEDETALGQWRTAMPG